MIAQSREPSAIPVPNLSSEVLLSYTTILCPCFYTRNIISGWRPCALNKRRNIQWGSIPLKMCKKDLQWTPHCVLSRISDSASNINTVAYIYNINPNIGYIVLGAFHNNLGFHASKLMSNLRLMRKIPSVSQCSSLSRLFTCLVELSPLDS